MKNWYPFPLKHDPGLILGPYESVVAMLAWLNECVKDARSGSVRSSAELFALPAPRVDSGIKDWLLSAFLLFGHFDASAGLALMDRYFAFRGRSESRREIFGELVSRDYAERYSPFIQSPESGLQISPIPLSHLLRNKDTRSLKCTLVRALRRAGYLVGAGTVAVDSVSGLRDARRVSTDEIDQEIGLWFEYGESVDWVGGILPMHVSLTLLATAAVVDRSVSHEVPVLSLDGCGPAWLTQAVWERPITVLQSVWNEVSWLPHPTSFREATSMMEDERLRELRQDVQRWSHRIAVGDLTNEAELRASIRKRLARFRSKPWAREIGRMVTYLAVPAWVAEKLIGEHYAGLSLAAIGTATEWIGGLMDARRRSSWLSLGRDFLE